MTLRRRIAPLYEPRITVERLLLLRSDALQRARYFDRLARVESDPTAQARYQRRAARAREVAFEYDDTAKKTAPRAARSERGITMPYEYPYKPLSNPDNLIVPKPGDGLYSRRLKHKRWERQKLRKAWQQEQTGDTPGKTP